MEIDAGFARRIRGVYGDAGETWLRELPVLVAEFTRRWNLSEPVPIDRPSYAWVAFADSPRGAGVLKLCVPNPETRTELAMLRDAASGILCALHEADEAAGAMLLERIRPGSTLLDVTSFEERVSIAASVIRGLHEHRVDPDPQTYPAYSDQARRAFAHVRALAAGATPGSNAAMGDWITPLTAAMERAERALDEPASNETLLHMDLHHQNILRGAGRWRVIDPKGSRAPVGWEAARFILNQYGYAEPDAARNEFPAMVDAFAGALGASPLEVARGAMLDACVSACWSVEDGDDELLTVSKRALELGDLAETFILERR